MRESPHGLNGPGTASPSQGTHELTVCRICKIVQVRLSRPLGIGKLNCVSTLGFAPLKAPVPEVATPIELMIDKQKLGWAHFPWMCRRIRYLGGELQFPDCSSDFTNQLQTCHRACLRTQHLGLPPVNRSHALQPYKRTGYPATSLSFFVGGLVWASLLLRSWLAFDQCRLGP